METRVITSETKVITKVNNVDIFITNDQDYSIPIRPICDALGIDYSTQLKKIKEDEDWASTVGQKPTVGADGKVRDMCCISKKYVLAWLLSINPANVKPEARQAVREYRNLCYDILYNFFFGQQEKLIQQNKIEIETLSRIAELKDKKQEISREISEEEKKLKKLQEEKMNNEPTLF